MQQFAVTFLLLILVACGDYTKTKLPLNQVSTQEVETVAMTSFSIDRMASQIHANVITQNINSLNSTIDQLQQDISTYCSGSTDNNKASAQKSWANSMKIFHRLELMAIGPLLENERESMKELYSWPEINSCVIDVEIATLSKDPQKYQLKEQINRRSLAAIEYLLFSDKDHSCPTPNATLKSWLSKDSFLRQKDRCQYLSLVTQQVISDKNRLLLKWKKYEESTLSPEQFIQEVSNSLFLTDTLIKDRKIGMPVGLHQSCPKKSCPDQIEHQWSGQSLDAIKENFVGFKQLMEGDITKAKHLGLFALLDMNGQKSVGIELIKRIDTVLLNIENQLMSKSFEASIREMETTTCSENGIFFGCTLHQSVKGVTDYMKVEFLAALSLRMSHHAEGDND